MKPVYDYIPGNPGKELVIFLHGLGCSRKSFADTVEAPSLKPFSLLNIDLIGFGESPKPEEFDYSMKSQAAVVSNLIRQFGQDRYFLVMHSMGGAIGLLLDEEIIERTVGIANLEGNLIGADCDMFSRRVVKFSEEKYDRLLFPKHKSAFKNHILFDFENSSPEAIYRSSKSLVDWSDGGELLTRFQNLGERAVYIYGEENREMEVLKRLGNINRIEISRSGHAMMKENAEEFNRILTRFIFSK